LRSIDVGKLALLLKGIGMNTMFLIQSERMLLACVDAVMFLRLKVVSIGLATALGQIAIGNSMV